MKRRAILSVILLAFGTISYAEKEIVGHGPARYEVDSGWAKVTPDQAPVINAHALAESSEGHIYVVTDHPENCFLVFEKNGAFLRSITSPLYGGHGMDFINKDGEELIIHVDCGWHFPVEGFKGAIRNGNGAVSLVSKQGKVLKVFPSPQDQGLAKDVGPRFKPCDVAVTKDNTILVADGYGSNFVFEYSLNGEILNHWGGAPTLKGAHGISIETRGDGSELVWVASRSEKKAKAFSRKGELVETLVFPGAFAGQIFVRGDKMYSAVCWSESLETGKRESESGFVLVLDRKTRKVISAPGGAAPVYEDGKLTAMTQAAASPFLHGHDLYVDSDGAIYVGEWNAQRRYPTKLTPVN